MNIKENWINYIHDLQDRICAALEKEDGKATFKEDLWQRSEGGGGKTRVIANGNVFEKGGVNTSVVFGEVTEPMRNQLKINGKSWFACGLSLVLHPVNPFVPTVHCNYRMFEVYDSSSPIGGGREAGGPGVEGDAGGPEAADRWFGGGTDLTP